MLYLILMFNMIEILSELHFNFSVFRPLKFLKILFLTNDKSLYLIVQNVIYIYTGFVLECSNVEFVQYF